MPAGLLALFAAARGPHRSQNVRETGTLSEWVGRALHKQLVQVPAAETSTLIRDNFPDQKSLERWCQSQ